MAQSPPPLSLRIDATVRESGETQHYHGQECEETWTRITKLGEGAYGAVWQEQCTSGPQHKLQHLRAVKVSRRRNEKAWRRELNAMYKFSQYPDRFVQLRGWFEDASSLYIAMEYIPHGTLHDHVRERPLPESEATVVVAQLGQALQYMHRADFIHRDLKLLNVLVANPAPDWHVKIADFGVSKDMNSMGMTTGDVGTLSYMAPEILLSRENKYTKAVDIWSLGVVAFSLLTRNPPFRHLHELMDFGKGGVPFPVKPLEKRRCSTLSVRFIEAAMAPERENRPTIDQVMIDSWLLPEPDSDSDFDDDFGAPSKDWADTWDYGTKQDSGVTCLGPAQRDIQPQAPGGIETLSSTQAASTTSTTTITLRPKAGTSSSDVPLGTAAQSVSTSVAIKADDGSQPTVKSDPEPQQNLQDEIQQLENAIGVLEAPQARYLREAGDKAIFVAAAQNWVNVLDHIIHIQGIDQPDSDGLTALHHAVLGNATEAVIFLVKHGSNVNASSKTHGTPLCLAAIKADYGIFVYLLDCQADILAPGGQFGSALHAACASGDTFFVRRLLEHGPPMNASQTVCVNFIAKFTERMQIDPKAGRFQYKHLQPLAIATRIGDLKMVKYLIQAGADVNAVHHRWESESEGVAFEDAEVKWKAQNTSALKVAAAWEYHEIVQHLLDSGARIDERDSSGATAVILAAEWDSYLSLKILLQRGASTHFRDMDGYNCLQLAAGSGRERCVTLLLDSGMDVRESDSHGYTALTSAAESGHLECVRILLARGSLVNTRTNEGTTPLHFATNNGHLEVMRILLWYGAHVDAQTAKGETPLMVAAYKKQLQAAKVLVELGASLVIRDSLNMTALQIAVETKDNEEVTAFLHEAGSRKGPQVQRVGSSGQYDEQTPAGRKSLRFWKK